MMSSAAGDSVVDGMVKKLQKEFSQKEVSPVGRKLEWLDAVNVKLEVIPAYGDPKGSHVTDTVVPNAFEGKRPVHRRVANEATQELRGMVNATSKKGCTHEGCKNQPIYNYENETKPLYCAEHRKDGMVNVRNAKCTHEGCKTQPTFNDENETKAIYCADHKKDGMVDVRNAQCTQVLSLAFASLIHNKQSFP